MRDSAIATCYRPWIFVDRELDRLGVVSLSVYGHHLWSSFEFVGAVEFVAVAGVVGVCWRLVESLPWSLEFLVILSTVFYARSSVAL